MQARHPPLSLGRWPGGEVRGESQASPTQGRWHMNHAVLGARQVAEADAARAHRQETAAGHRGDDRQEGVFRQTGLVS